VRAAAALLAAALGGWAGPCCAVDPNFRDGLWRVDVETEMRGGGLKPSPPYRYQACYSKQDITQRLTAPGGPCRAIPTEAREEEMSWRLQCSPKVGEVAGRIHMKFLGDRMEGTIVTRTSYPETMEVTQRIAGRRVGDCKTVARQPVPGAGASPRSVLKDYEEEKK
jgi:hypothetical protein